MNEPSGIDFAAGLALVGSDALLYHRVLQTFFANHRHDAVLLRQAIAADDAEAARMIAHNLKGVVGMLGAGSLQMTAERAMLACGPERRVAEDWKPSVETLARDIGPVLAAVRGAIEGADGAAEEAGDGVVPMDSGLVRLERVIEDLARMLSEANPAAAGLVRVLCRELDAATFGAELMLLDRRVSTANFEGARDALDDLRRLRLRCLHRRGGDKPRAAVR